MAFSPGSGLAPTVHILCLSYLKHPFQVLESLPMSWWVDPGVFNQGNIQNVQGCGTPGQGLGNTGLFDVTFDCLSKDYILLYLEIWLNTQKIVGKEIHVVKWVVVESYKCTISKKLWAGFVLVFLFIFYLRVSGMEVELMRYVYSIIWTEIRGSFFSWPAIRSL